MPVDRGGGVLRRRRGAHAGRARDPRAPGRRRARLPAARPAAHHAVGRRAAAAQARDPHGREGRRLRARRADHRAAPGRRRAAARPARPAGRRRQVGHRDRAPPGGDGARRLDHRPRAGRRPRRRADRVRRHAGRPGGGPVDADRRAPGGLRQGSSAALTTINNSIYILGEIMPDKPRAVDPLLPLKPKVLHILLAVADGPRHGYSIMQEVLERTDGQVRLWPAALYGLLRELEKIDLIAESDKRPSADEDDERRRYFALTPHGKRVLGRRGASPRSDCHSRPLEPRAAKAAARMTGDRFLRWSARSYAQLLRVLRLRDSQERHAIREDGERLLEAAHTRAASRSRQRGSRWSGISSLSASGTTSPRHCGRSYDLRESRSGSPFSSGLASPPPPRSSRS